MSARSLFRADYHMVLVAIRSQWPSVALQARSWMVKEKPKLAGNGRFRSNNGDRRFESILLRHTVWHASLHYGEAMKSARGARFTRGRGRGECQRQRLSVKIALNSLFAILACPSANRPTFCGEAFSGRTLPDASNYARVSLSGFQSLLLRTPERGEFDSLGHR